MSLARQNLFQNRLRLLLSAVGVALSVMLILILNGFLSGVYKQASAYLDHSPGSVVVVQGVSRTSSRPAPYSHTGASPPFGRPKGYPGCWV